MSAFAVCFRRDGAPVSRALIESMLDAQPHGGSDSRDSHVAGAVGMGHRSLWTTPEDVGTSQPLAVSGLPYRLVWNGRIDNRGDLIRQLGASRSEASRWSDAELFLRLYAEKEHRALPCLVGAFALAVCHTDRRQIVLARDPMGHRGLSYHLGRRLLVAAGSEAGVLAHPEIAAKLNPRRLASYFAYTGVHDDETFFDEVARVLPGHYVLVNSGKVETHRYWRANPGARIRYRDDRDYAEHYRALLEQAVECRLRSSSPVGVMTSGGLDSGPLAAIAATRAPTGGSVHALSWTFDRYPECDERQYIRPLCAAFDLPLHEVNCDDAGPFKNLAQWPTHPDTPEQDPYRRFLDLTYETARNAGIRVVLNGGAGDNLYISGDRWFWELLGARRPAAALTAARWYIHHAGSKKFARNILIRSLVPARFMARARPPQPPEWLTDRAAGLLDAARRWPPEHLLARRPNQFRALLSLRTAEFLNAESFWSKRLDVEVRYPLRDRRIVEFMLQLPDAQLRLAGTSRPVLRRAVSDLLPDPQLTRRDKTVFTPLFDHGARAEAARIDSCIRDPANLWSIFLREEWLGGQLGATKITVDTLKWLVVSAEMWRANHYLSL